MFTAGGTFPVQAPILVHDNAETGGRLDYPRFAAIPRMGVDHSVRNAISVLRYSSGSVSCTRWPASIAVSRASDQTIGEFGEVPVGGPGSLLRRR